MSELVDEVIQDPMAEAARLAVRLTTDLIAEIAPHDLDVAADLVESLAVLECCAVEATRCRGRVRRKLADLARAHATRSHAALVLTVQRQILDGDTVSPARAALTAAIAMLEPPRRLPVSELLRR